MLGIQFVLFDFEIEFVQNGRLFTAKSNRFTYFHNNFPTGLWISFSEFGEPHLDSRDNIWPRVGGSFASVVPVSVISI